MALAAERLCRYCEALREQMKAQRAAAEKARRRAKEARAFAEKARRIKDAA